MRMLRLALAQINPTVGDLEGNAEKILASLKTAKQQKADIAVFPELALSGYPPEDLVFKPQFIADNVAAIKKISSRVSGIAAIIGFIDRGDGGEIYNAAAFIAEKRIADIYHKIFLPNYGVFDEFRYFEAGIRFPVYVINKIRVGINICEDIWHRNGPAHVQAHAGAEIIININASPYERDKPATRAGIVSRRAAENGVMIAYLNAVGGQDELVFDGQSMVFDHRGCLIARAKQFEEQLMVLELDADQVRKFRKSKQCPKSVSRPEPFGSLKEIRVASSLIAARRPAALPVVNPVLKPEEEIYRALVLGTSDYVRKNGFKGVVIGLSGGIDSSLVAAIAADAIGRKNVHGLFMPSGYTSKESREDAYGLAENLGISITEMSIDPIFQIYLGTLRKSFEGKEPDTTEENLQARIRGNLLMALSNKFGWLVLTTGNKSEMSVGYATLYGDMAGGFAVIKDVPKTLVYEICSWINTRGKDTIIPDRVLRKEPTAELRPGQKDTDSLPPYELLDPILKAYIEDDLSFGDILKLGCDRECAKKVINMVDKSEYKRRQSPPGIKITARAFGRDRRFPITNRYRSY